MSDRPSEPGTPPEPAHEPAAHEPAAHEPAAHEASAHEPAAHEASTHDDHLVPIESRRAGAEGGEAATTGAFGEIVRGAFGPRASARSPAQAISDARRRPTTSLRRPLTSRHVRLAAEGFFGHEVAAEAARPSVLAAPGVVSVHDADPAGLTRLVTNAVSRGARLVSLFASDERKGAAGAFALYALLAEDAKGRLALVRALLDPAKPTYPSLSLHVPAAAWPEREARDLLGLEPEGHPDLRPLVRMQGWPEGWFPLRKDAGDVPPPLPAGAPLPFAVRGEAARRVHGDGTYVVPVGPIHAGIIEPGGFKFSQAGEPILHLDAQLFFTHRGLEKAAEGLDQEAALAVARKLCGVCSVSHELAFAEAVERAARVEVPPVAQLDRVILAELERLYNHVGDIGNIAAGFGLAFATQQGLRHREALLRLNERVAGHRYLRGAVALGGVSDRVAIADNVVAIQTGIVAAQDGLTRVIDVMFEQAVALDRMESAGILSHANALRAGAVGVTARASEVPLDVRRSHPYAFYAHVRPEKIVEKTGDVRARALVRAREALNSIRLIKAALADHERGERRVAVPPPAPGTLGVGIVESPRGETVHAILFGEGGKVERFHVRSASYRNWPAIPLAAPGNIIPDFPLINKSFELCYSCTDK